MKKCKHCGFEWKDGSAASQFTSCPACKESVAEKSSGWQYFDNTKELLAFIAVEYGVESLFSGKNFSDHALATMPVGQKNLVKQALNCGAVNILKDNLNSDQTNKERAVKLAVRKLVDTYSSAEVAATRIINEFATALGWNILSTPNSTSVASSAIFDPLVPTQSAVSVGGIIPFGEYQWRILDIQGNRALIITEDIIEKRVSYNDNDNNATWEICYLRKYLNGEFLNKFDDSRIITVSNKNADNLWYGTKGGNNTNDKIFLLSIEEADAYFGNSGDYLNKRKKCWNKINNRYVYDSINGYCLSNNFDSYRIAKYKNEPWWWWLRSPGQGNNNAANVEIKGNPYDSDGHISVSGCYNTGLGGIRPALWLDLSIAESKVKPQLQSINPHIVPQCTPTHLNVGDIIPFGDYKWRVLNVQNDKALIITEDIIFKRAYDEQSTDTTWEMSELREYLNNEFVVKFDSTKIVMINNKNTDNLWYGTKGGNDTNDKVFLLSLEEVDMYFGNSGDYQKKRRKTVYSNEEYYERSDGLGFSNSNNSKRIAKLSGEVSTWLLRSPGNCNGTVAYVEKAGYVIVQGSWTLDYPTGVRPALWLSLK
jgi:co-chaperonin GroES (HSP10)